MTKRSKQFYVHTLIVIPISFIIVAVGFGYFIQLFKISKTWEYIGYMFVVILALQAERFNIQHHTKKERSTSKMIVSAFAGVGLIVVGVLVMLRVPLLLIVILAIIGGIALVFLSWRVSTEITQNNE